jgi:Kef-type K+ transport system membrane component KefB
MPATFDVALFSALLIGASGIASIALARFSRIHPAYFFIACGFAAYAFLPFLMPGQSLLFQLAELGAVFIVFLAALEIDWDLQFIWRLRDLLLAFVLQLGTAIPVVLIFWLILKVDPLSSIAMGLLAGMHAPDRKSSLIVESFRNASIRSNVGFMGLVSEITALVGIALMIALTQHLTITGDLLQALVGAILLLLVLISSVPQVLRFLVRRLGEYSYALFYVILTLLLTVIYAVRRAGIEPLLGAYAAGFLLTRFVTEGSQVLARLRFTGHSIIVPAFYLQMGLSGSLFTDLNIGNFLAAGALLLVTAVMRSALLMLFRNDFRSFSTGLSETLRKNPIILVLIYLAHARGILSTSAMQTMLIYTALNEILVIIVLRLRGQASHIAPAGISPRILLPVSNPESMLPLLTLATHLGSDSQSPKIYPLNIVADGPGAEDRIRLVERQFNEIVPAYVAREQHIELTARIEDDRVKAVTHAARELLTDRILVGLGAIPTLQRPQGYSFLEALTQNCPGHLAIAAHIESDLSLTSAMHVIIAHPRLLDSYATWLPTILHLASRLKVNPVFHTEPEILADLQQALTTQSSRKKYSIRTGHLHAGLDLLTLGGDENSIHLAVLERPGFYPQEKIHARLPEMMLRAFASQTFMLMYPPTAQQVVRPGRARRGWQKFKKILRFGE